MMEDDMEEMMTIYEVVKKIIGNIEPVGETEEDDCRYENLIKTIDLISSLVGDVEGVSTYKYKTSKKDSMQRAGKYADKFLHRIKNA
jgi:hypothetical protein